MYLDESNSQLRPYRPLDLTNVVTVGNNDSKKTHTVGNFKTYK